MISFKNISNALLFLKPADFSGDSARMVVGRSDFCLGVTMRNCWNDFKFNWREANRIGSLTTVGFFCFYKQLFFVFLYFASCSNFAICYWLSGHLHYLHPSYLLLLLLLLSLVFDLQNQPDAFIFDSQCWLCVSFFYRDFRQIPRLTIDILKVYEMKLLSWKMAIIICKQISWVLDPSLLHSRVAW